MQSASELKSLLARIDRRGYPAYKETRGSYQFPGYLLSIDHVQGDPFAAPSRLSIRVQGKDAAFPPALYRLDCQRVALEDALLRRFGQLTQQVSFTAKGSGHSGLISVSRCGQQVLERTACRLDPERGDLLLRLEVGFPANGRTINARELEKILFELLPRCVERALYYRSWDLARLQAVADLAEDQQAIRSALAERGLCAFVANGSILPRASGISPLPMPDAVPFRSPEELEITLTLPHRGTVRGMGLPRGITLIVGGGYHGKSTLLRALELGVYNHIAGDGREYVITDDSAVNIRSEDGRSVRSTDISAFINDLPSGKDTLHFSTEDASGSTSQAANLIEAVEAGSRLLLIDEDTSATNFMVRDALMQRVVCREMEPITPFLDRARELFENWGISTVLVAGSSGAFFHIADRVIQMERYLPREITAMAKREAAAFSDPPAPLSPTKKPDFDRRPLPGPEFSESERIKLKVLGQRELAVGRDQLDLRGLEQLADPEQTAALGRCLIAAEKQMDGRRTMQQLAAELDERIEARGLEVLCAPGREIGLARPRKQEIFACLNRYRALKL